jgi:hypothetical protein
LETFVRAIELLAEKHHLCEVGFIGTGEGDASFGRIPWQVSQLLIHARGKESAGPGSKRKSAHGAWPSSRSARETKLDTFSKSSGRTRNTRFSSWRANFGEIHFVEREDADFDLR